MNFSRLVQNLFPNIMPFLKLTSSHFARLMEEVLLLLQLNFPKLPILSKVMKKQKLSEADLGGSSQKSHEHSTVLWWKKKKNNTSKSLRKTVSRIFFQDYMRSNGKSQSLSEGNFALFQPSCPLDLNKLTTVKQG